MNTITIAIKKPYEPWEMLEVEDALPTYQKIVGGYIEHFLNVGPNRDIALFCNEEGKLKGMEPNFYVPQLNDMIVGPVFAARSGDEGELESLDEDDLVTLTGEF